jgi:hypothetical protein
MVLLHDLHDELTIFLQISSEAGELLDDATYLFLVVLTFLVIEMHTSKDLLRP